MTERCPWNNCGLPATEKRSMYEQRWRGVLFPRRLPDIEHPMYFCPKHARWHDHPEEQQPEVPEPWIEDGIKVTMVDVSWDYDGRYQPHSPDEWDVREYPEDATAYPEDAIAVIRVRFWRANPGQNGYQSYDLQRCDVVEALAWANKKIAPVPGGPGPRDSENQFAGGTFQLGVFMRGEPDPEQSPDSKGPDRVIWLYGDHPFSPMVDDS